jgi:hypothetical protein
MLVVGNTSTGIYKDNLPQILIHIGAIPELHFATLDSQNGATFGAAVSISQVMKSRTRRERRREEERRKQGRGCGQMRRIWKEMR